MQQELMVADWALIWVLGYDWGLRKALYMITWLRKKEQEGMHKSHMISIWSTVKRDFFPQETDSIRIGWYGLKHLYISQYVSESEWALLARYVYTYTSNLL